jgi:hypothetical protein
MGNAGSAPEQAKNAVDRAKAEARCVPPLMVRFVPGAAMWHVGDESFDVGRGVNS